MKRKNKIISIILYSLPVLFFIVSYFLITTSGEDIFQGANNFRTDMALAPIDDAINAFNYNSRITDMYAWSVIDYFDYQYSFGPDTIFRLIDVVLVSGVFYFATYIVLGRKPKLIIKDSLVFCATFLTFIITPFGRVFYTEFSMIHNYVPLALATLLFSMPFLKLAQNQTFTKKHQKILNIFLPILGIYFGMAATITPLAFLATTVIYCLIKRKKLTRPPLWLFTSLVGVITGFAICWLVGSGVDHYTSAQAINFDYAPLSDFFSSPLSFISKVLWHEVYNFGLVLLPLCALFIICYLFSKPKIKIKKLDQKTKNLILIFTLFIVIHLLGASLIKAPFRLSIPAYLAGIIILLKIFTPTINSKLISVAIVLLIVPILLIHAVLLIKYRSQTAEVFKTIQASDDTNLCIEAKQTSPPRLRFVDLSQADILVDWGYPEPIYGKNITVCK